MEQVSSPSTINLHFFHRLIASGDIYEAAQVIAGAAETTPLPEKAADYDSHFFRVHLRALSMPLYRRYKLDHLTVTTRFDDDELLSVYPAAGKLLDTLLKQHNRLVTSGYSAAAKALSDLRGDRSELIIFCLHARGLTGTAEDEFTVVPSSLRQDASRPQGGVKDGFDFLAHHRPSGRELPVQVKTSDKRGATYDPRIAVVRLSGVAGDNDPVEDMGRLERAIIADTMGVATSQQVNHIEQATMRLDHLYLTKLVDIMKKVERPGAV